MKRAATLVLVMLAMSASAAVDARALAHEGQKTQWAPTRNFSSLNARVVFAGESRRATSPYAGEEWETAAGEKDWQYAAGNPTRFTDPSGRCAFGPESVDCAEVLSAFARESLGQRVEYDGRWRRADPGLWSISVFNEDTWKANEEARWWAGWNSYITDMPAPVSGDAADLWWWKYKRGVARSTEASMQAIDTGSRAYLEYVAIPYLTGEVGGVAFEGIGLFSKVTTEELATTRNLVRLETITEKQVMQSQVRIAVERSRSAAAGGRGGRVPPLVDPRPVRGEATESELSQRSEGGQKLG